jgi:hypothetical protein
LAPHGTSKELVADGARRYADHRVPTKFALASTALLLTAIAGSAASPASAHHSWSTHYDLSRSTSVSGTLRSAAFRNPHSALVLNVTTDDGRREQWTVEWGSPQRLRERGITERTLRVGEPLHVTGNPHRDEETKSVRALSVRRDDGTEVGNDQPAGR